MPISPKEDSGVGLYPYNIPFAATLTDFSSPDVLPTICTLSWWVDRGSGYEHIFVRNNSGRVTIYVNNGDGVAYTGGHAPAYSDLVKIIMTQLYGGYSGYNYAEIHCADQLVDISVFAQYSPADPNLWVPKLVEIPEYTYTSGDQALSSLGASASASGYYLSYYPANAIDGGVTGDSPLWVSNLGDTAPTYTVTLPAEQTITSYAMVNRTADLTQIPKSWTFEGSNDGSTWDVLHIVSGELSWAANERREFDCDTTGSYLYYRLNVSANNGNTNNCGFIEFQMYADLTDIYGPEGADLDFAISADLGNDLSGNNNDWSITGTQTAKTPTK
ncbi:discoidin domain-containing protein [Pseudodesulfovibrio sp.]|uniref:discoidin domain-containing protein n=1 Tax=unclassified Pseudodesulfovibrio TaxID=2661612 RepID=UPI003B0074AA